MARKGDPDGEPSGAWRYARQLGSKTVVAADGTVRIRPLVLYGYGASKPKARAAFDRKRQQHEAGTDPGRQAQGATLPLQDYLIWWLRHEVRPARGWNTWRLYEGLCRRYLAPALGHLPLASLTPEAIQATLGRLLTAGGADEDGLAPETVLATHRCLSTALNRAVALRYIVRNPAKDVTRVRADPAELHCLSLGQARALLAGADAACDRQSALWHLLLDSGCRIGEALALRWADVSLAADRGSVRISRTLITVRRGPAPLQGIPVFGPPKTKRSRRTVTIGPRTVAALLAHQRRQAVDRARHESDSWALGLVFCTRYGAPHRATNIRAALRVLLRSCGLPADVRVHDLRHTSATLALANGGYLKAVSRRLGHSSERLTLAVYSHVLDEHEQQVAGIMADLLAPDDVSNAASDQSDHAALLVQSAPNRAIVALATR